MFPWIYKANWEYSDKYKHSGYSIESDPRSEFLLTDSDVGKIAIIFGVDMRSSVQIEKK